MLIGAATFGRMTIGNATLIGKGILTTKLFY